MTRRARRGVLIYAALVLLSASGRAWQVHSAPFDCADDGGHGPDPNSIECESSVAHARERRLEDTLKSFIAVVILGALGLGAYGALRLSLRIEFVRRFVDDGGPS